MIDLPVSTAKWDTRFLRLAFEVASWSKDHSTKVGAVIIGPDKDPRSFGYNGLPRGVNDNVPERFIRPNKYAWTEHAERNALANCNRVGIPTNLCSMYVTHFPCSHCARMIIQSGIKEVVVDKESIANEFGERWGEDLQISLEMLQEAGVKVSLASCGEKADLRESLNTVPKNSEMGI
ncbi:MAG: dCMP deaminase family protein [Bdellovibrionota bacterium]|nr:CMP deaminase [Pseudobdellovibrionaceae bacterium]|tara:strand:+ start:17043 stop:17576 length:534 start_codon:yes stop_codon:yes gene_type:complete